MQTGRAVNGRFGSSQTGYTRATGPDFAFQADPSHRTGAATRDLAEALDPNISRFDTEYNSNYGGSSNQITDRTIRACFTNPYTGKAAPNQLLSTGQYLQDSLPPGQGSGQLSASGFRDSRPLAASGRVLIPGSQPGTNEGTRSLQNTDTQRVYTVDPDLTFGGRTGAAYPLTGSGRLDGLQQLGATQPALARSLRASQGIIPDTLGDLQEYRDQAVTGIGNQQFPEWHATAQDKLSYSQRVGTGAQDCSGRTLIPGLQPGGNEGTQQNCGLTRTVRFEESRSASSLAKPLYQTQALDRSMSGAAETLPGTGPVPEVPESGNDYVPTLPALRGSKTPSEAAVSVTPSQKSSRVSSGATSVASSTIGQPRSGMEMNTQRTLDEVLHNHNREKNAGQPPTSPEASGTSPVIGEVTIPDHESVARPDLGSEGLHTARSLSQSMTRVAPSSMAVASSGSINERGYNEPPGSANPYARTCNSQQLYQPSFPAYNPSHSYSAFANSTRFPSGARCYGAPGGCQCGPAPMTASGRLVGSAAITDDGIEYVKPPGTTFCDAPVARRRLGEQRHAYPRTASQGAYTSIEQMEAAGFCDAKLFKTVQPTSDGSGGTTYKSLNAYIPAYSAYRRDFPGNYTERHGEMTGTVQKVTDDGRVSNESGFIENCKFNTKPFTFKPGERPIGLTEPPLGVAGNRVGGGGNADPNGANEFLTTYGDHFRAIHEPQYGLLHAGANDGRVPSEPQDRFDGLLSNTNVRASGTMTYKAGFEPVQTYVGADAPRRCTCYDKINKQWM